ncbi:MAG TPA: cobalamin biosynthesis protein CobN [Methanophagales archaeon]|nr:cobalamin biosynthesis protein CobN [Methanophagales archaeon]
MEDNEKVKIAVAGKGGVGKTTIAGTLARLLARDGHTVIAVDADPSMNLKFALGIRDNPKPISELKDLIFERTNAYSGIYKLNPKVNDIITRYGAEGPDGVTLLVMGTIEKGGSGCTCPENAFLRSLLRHTLFKENTVIMDMEAGIEHLGRGTAKGVDLLLAVVEPGMRSVETVGRIKKLGKDIGIKNMAAVMNKVTDLEMVELIETKLTEMGIPLLETIPYEPELIKADMENKAPLDIGGDAVEHIKTIKEKIITEMSIGQS